MILNHYRQNLRTAVGSSAAPYGYTLATWTTGAVLGFAFVGALAFGGLTRHYDQERGRALLWGSFHFFSVGLAIGVAALVAHYVGNSIVWLLAAFLSTVTYLLAVGAESTVAYLWDHRKET